jgi:hypothetical protein
MHFPMPVGSWKHFSLLDYGVTNCELTFYLSVAADGAWQSEAHLLVLVDEGVGIESNSTS